MREFKHFGLSVCVCHAERNRSLIETTEGRSNADAIAPGRPREERTPTPPPWTSVGTMRINSPRPKKRLFLSLAVRITIPVAALVVAVTIGVYTGLVRQSRGSLLQSKEAAADMVIDLAAISVMPSVVFGDPDGMQRAMNDLARNPEISAAELWSFDVAQPTTPAPLVAVRRTGGTLGRPDHPLSRRWIEGDSVRLIEPVINPEGATVAAITARFSTEREAAALAQLERQVLYVSAATALCLALAILWVINRVVVGPVMKLNVAAQKLARGERENASSGNEARIEDEVVRLGETFQEMADAVRDRETRLGLRNAELKLILDSVRQGFASALPNGMLQPERSAILDSWFGPLPPDETIFGLIGRIDPRARDWFEFAWQQLFDGLLPTAAALDQLPQRLERGVQHFELGYHVVTTGEAINRLVLVVTDVTAEVERERERSEQHEFAALVDRFVRARREFMDFWLEAGRLVHAIVEPSTGESSALQRDVHTLKGNARVFGLNRVAALCHRFEEGMKARGASTLLESEQGELRGAWNTLRERMEPLMQGATGFLEISQASYSSLLGAVRRRAAHRELEELVSALRSEPTATRLERAKRVIETTCQKLGKRLPTVTIDSGDVRLPADALTPFWSALTHVLSNAVDHGLDSDEERMALGKPIPARIALSTGVRNGELVIEIKDDGRGIDWNKVRDLARARALPADSRDDLVRALMADGFSLRTQATEVSGRGVGLAAVNHVVTQLGGRLELDSSVGQGTTWRFTFPFEVLSRAELDEEDSRANTVRVDQHSKSAALVS